MWIMLIMVSFAVSSQCSGLVTLEGRHPLVSPTACHAFGPQAVLEALKQKVDVVNAGQQDKYHKILRYLTEAPTLLDDYYKGPSNTLPAENDAALSRLENSLRRRLEALRLDVLLPWARLMQVQELADVRGPRQAANRAALYTNLRLTLNDTEFVEQAVVDNVSGLVEEFRQLFLMYKDIMASWLSSTWMSDTPAQKQETLNNILNEDFPAMLGKPLFYFFEDKNLDIYYPYPCGYEEVFEIFRKLRSVANKVESTSGDDAKWKVLLEQLPKNVKPDPPAPMTQAQLDMEEELLAVHMIDMLTGYPRQRSKKY
ncbi:uncharacterized protein LOC122377820 [Amphibalanus amphitrite]|uniref:uncharacterized protein LOC122375496 n=1 Tax=Amphibalanus amphitrite TaxID=1232801 RepID=UPI001C91AF23|nr:uncharacterized protein LOC122375496 [Amphibalanus amphitrite]XP_043214200.1 uncharacterized protein LOC122377820 [Amphibalanus amphitrite]